MYLGRITIKTALFRYYGKQKASVDLRIRYKCIEGNESGS